jgi:hypothetical protein
MQQHLTVIAIVVHATPLAKLMIFGLLAAIVAAIVVAARKLGRGQKLSGGSAYLSGLRVGGPMAGALGGAYTLLNMAMGMSNALVAPTAQVLAPGLAEAAFLVTLGLLTGAVAVAAHWAVEARIDRTVLEA